MKAKGFSVILRGCLSLGTQTIIKSHKELMRLFVVGGYDSNMGHGTYFCVGDVEVRDNYKQEKNQLSFPLSGLKIDQEAILEIPSGLLRGKISRVEVSGEFVWPGGIPLDMDGLENLLRSQMDSSAFWESTWSYQEEKGPFRMDGPIQISLSHCEWDGKEGGLFGGKSYLFDFEVKDMKTSWVEVVESTLLPPGQSITYAQYDWAKQGREMVGGGDDTARELIRRILQNK